ncbi:SRX2 [Auxenochlorella protothecoides x Auxenochlorella symbiontica]|uniref:sulfiredoxin n=1 Tax=Auxenochlorella protothecoides TaxID=3075 RepID=A0A087SF06_AUXPR|nr:Sulfiredoxin-1 [Auxenochlorella protothecoides]KFM24310.1 Sulfiredoxin-1 [Auxenochlorella protothecoides]RMZ52427.1 hypothetical protein APUTEX25_000006 [Auxenochlorella protothecoides]|eukprot:RMZ52427.1 hypothetical protein APUTEX25_000006 [Auxenochlorella protothecoides]
MATSGSEKDIAAKFGWDASVLEGGLQGKALQDPQVQELPIGAIRRPIPRANNPEKVEALMASIGRVGLQEPIDVLEVEGVYYGFSGCHRFEAHQRMGKNTILCRVRKANRQVLRFHMM